MRLEPPEVASDDRWCVRLFGAFRAERGGTSASFRTRKTAGLLAYLAFHAGKPISKDLLVETFWPETNATQGRQSLRMALSSLRSSLALPGWDPDRYLLSDREVVELSEDGITTDVREFLAGIEAARASSGTEKIRLLREAMTQWSGPFVDGASEPWITPQALELEEFHANALRELTSALCEAGNTTEAAEWARRSLALFPMREDLHVTLMRVYAASGNNSMVLKQFEELEQMLEDSWGEMPGEEAMSLIEALPRRDRPNISAQTLAPVACATAVKKSFFGRGRELDELEALLAPNREPRLLNLVGLGGSGKTRLAQRAIETQSRAYEGRAWFVSLVGLESVEQIWASIAEVFGQTAGQGLTLSIAAKLNGEPAFLALDNLEHLATDCALVVSELLEACPSLKILATSRVPLGLPGERLYPVPPLSLPKDFRDLPALRRSPCVELLVDAAQTVRPGFSVTPANAQSVLLLVQRMEGIPLAIELAAAKLGSLTPAQVIASLARRVDIETARPIVREQHRSLRIIIEWSLGLLSEGDRQGFATLGVCRGGFDIALATALLGTGADEQVERLCRCSLVSWAESAEEVRFSMLETVREMAVQMLDEDSRLHREATLNHFNHLLALTNSAQRVSNPGAWATRVANESGNILGAIEAAINGMVGAPLAWELVFPLGDYLERKGGPQMWLVPFESLLESTIDELTPLEAAQAHMLLAETHYGMRNIKSTFVQYQLAQSAADLSEDRKLRIASRTDSVSAAITLGEFDLAQGILEQAIELLPESGDDIGRAHCLLNLAWLVFDRGNEEESEPLFGQALDCAEVSKDRSMIAGSLVGLGCAIGHTRYDESQKHFDRAQQLLKQTEWPSRLAHSYYYRALIDYRHNHLDVALRNLRTSYETYVDCGVTLGQSSLTIGGNIFAALDRWPEALLCWKRGEITRTANKMPMIPCLVRDYERHTLPSEFKQTTIEMPASDRDFVETLFQK